MRGALVVAAGLLVAALTLVVVGIAAAPLSRTCAPELPEPACAAAVDAVLQRGMPVVHPLILEAHVEPGPAPEADQLGHRASVEFALLGVPGVTTVALHYDQGAHWGGVADRDRSQLAAWALAPLLLAGLAGAGLLGLARRRQGTAAARGEAGP